MMAHRQSGQALTEMVVAFAFVVVPLFLLVPLIGKMIDMKHATVSAARYVTWEQTTSWDPSGDGKVPVGFDAFSDARMPTKSNLMIEREVQQRVFANASNCLKPWNLTSNDVLRRGDVSCSPGSTTVGRNLWTYHDGRSMVGSTLSDQTTNVGLGSSSEPFATIYRGINLLGDVAKGISTVTGIFDPSRRFDVIQEVGHSDDINIALCMSEPPNYTDLQGDTSALITMQKQTQSCRSGNDFMDITARGAIVSRGWSAGGPDHLKNRSQALVPWTILDDILGLKIPGINVKLQDIAATILLSPEFSSGNLVFGQLDTESLPFDKFEDNTLEHYTEDEKDQVNGLCMEGGYCRE